MKTFLLLAFSAVLVSSGQISKEVHQKVVFKDVPREVSSLSAKASGHNLGVVNGNVASRTQFPFQAGLYLDYSAFCGGSLIHPKWVLTAAHCVSGKSKWAVFLGVTDMMSAKQEGRIVLITSWGVNHEDYNSQRITNDIGVLQLPREVQLNEYIRLSRLAPPAVNYAGQNAAVSGFGLVDDNAPKVISPVLMYTSLPIVSNQLCYDFYGDADVSQICLRAGDGTSSCNGDSGGPLTLNDTDGTLIQVGLTSFGCRSGCTLGCPLGFTRINIFYDWLSEKTGINFPLEDYSRYAA